MEFISINPTFATEHHHNPVYATVHHTPWTTAACWTPDTVIESSASQWPGQTCCYMFPGRCVWERGGEWGRPGPWDRRMWQKARLWHCTRPTRERERERERARERERFKPVVGCYSRWHIRLTTRGPGTFTVCLTIFQMKSSSVQS